MCWRCVNGTEDKGTHRRSLSICSRESNSAPFVIAPPDESNALASQKFLFHGIRVAKWSLTHARVCVWVFCHGSAAASILPKFTPNMKLQRKIGNRAVGWVQQLSPGCWLCVSDGLVLIAAPIAANCFLIQNVKPTRKTGRISQQGYAIPPILVGQSYKK